MPPVGWSFLLTRPSRGATISPRWLTPFQKISTHTPLAGRDLDVYGYAVNEHISTHTPLAGRDYSATERGRRIVISTHTPLAGRDNQRGNCGVVEIISTHTPLAGRDVSGNHSSHMPVYFYSHAPRGARLPPLVFQSVCLLFLLTRPSRGATERMASIAYGVGNFYSHAPRGARL